MAPLEEVTVERVTVERVRRTSRASSPALLAAMAMPDVEKPEKPVYVEKSPDAVPVSTDENACLCVETVERVRRKSRAASPAPLAAMVALENTEKPVYAEKCPDAVSTSTDAHAIMAWGTETRPSPKPPASGLRARASSLVPVLLLALAVWLVLPPPVAAALRRAWDWAPLSFIFALAVPTSTPAADGPASSSPAARLLRAGRRALCFALGLALLAVGAWASGSSPIWTAGIAAAVVLYKKVYGDDVAPHVGKPHAF